jgi:formylglycine-generating enzyme required for sulfatase activity
MSDAAPPPGWQRRQDLLDRLADIQAETEEIRRALQGVNDTTLRPRVEALIAAALRLVAAHGTQPGEDVAEALAALQSSTRTLRVPATDPDLGVTETLRTLRAAQGRLRSAVDDALEAATGTGLVTQPFPRQPEATAALPLPAMLARLDAVARRLDVMEAAAAEPTTLVQQTGLVNFYAGKMRVHVDLARLTLTIGEDSFDFGALSRAAEAMADLTEDFAATVQAWARRLSNRLSPVVVESATAALAVVRRVVTGAAKLGRLVLRRVEKRRAAAAFDGPRVVPPETVLVPPGEFMMGVPEKESRREKCPKDLGKQALPIHRVTIRRGFRLMRYPVTRGQFASFIEATGHDMSGEVYCYVDGKWQESDQFSWRNPGFEQTDNDPVVCVSYDDATAYARWLSDQTRQAWRLPSEAEWEYAARAGTTTARYWGNGWDRAVEFARVEARGTAPVGSYKPNAFGLQDMLGNVWEWTDDPWHDNYENAPDDGSVWNDGGAPGRRVLRGGAWGYVPRDVRAGVRVGIVRGGRYGDVGFRLARTSF